MDESSEPRTGLLLPDFEDISKEWKAMIAAESLVWQGKVDRLTTLVETLVAEIQALRGVTITIDREE